MSRICFVALSPDGRTVRATDKDGMIAGWGTDAGDKLKGLERVNDEAMSYRAAALSTDGETAARFDPTDGAIQLWRVGTGKDTLRIESGPLWPFGMYFSDDGKCLAAMTMDQKVHIWDTNTGKERRQYPAPRRGLTTAFALAPDGGMLAWAMEEGVICLFDAATSKEPFSSRGHQAGIYAVAFTADGKTVISASADGSIRFWDAESGREVRSLPGHEGALTGAFDSSGRRHVSLNQDGVLQFRDLVTNQQRVQPHGRDHIPWCLALASDGKTIATGASNGAIRLWDAATGESKGTLEDDGGPAHTMAFSPDGKFLAAVGADGGVRFWDCSTHKVVREAQPREGTLSGLRLTFSPDGEMLISGGTDRLYLSRNIFSDEWRELARDLQPTLAISVSFDGQTMASGGADQKIHLWELATGNPIDSLEGHQGVIHCLAFSPDGRKLVSGSDDSTLLVWDLTSGCVQGESNPARTGPSDLGSLWMELKSRDAALACKASWSLAGSSDQAVHFLQEHLVPAAAVSPERVARLIDDLNNDDWDAREAAAAALADFGEAVGPALRRKLQNPLSLEAQRRLERLLEKLETEPPPPEVVRAIRAIQVLERIGSPGAAQVLEKLGDGSPDARLTREARKALDRLAQFP